MKQLYIFSVLFITYSVVGQSIYQNNRLLNQEQETQIASVQSNQSENFSERSSEINTNTAQVSATQNYHQAVVINNGRYAFPATEDYQDFSVIGVMKAKDENTQQILDVYPKDLKIKSDMVQGVEEIKIQNIITPSIISYSESIQDRRKDSTGYFQLNPNAEYYEILTFNKSISRSKRAVAESYLAMKFGITLSTDYVNSKRDTLFSYEENKGFTSNILALGRDDKTGLHQRQAQDAEKLFSFGLENLQKLNNENAIDLNNNTFLFVSDNGKFSTKENGVFSQSERVWKISTNDDSMLNETYQFQFNYTQLFQEELQEDETIWLMLNPDQEIRAKNVIQATAINDSIATFSNLHFSDYLNQEELFFSVLKAPDFFVIAEFSGKNCFATGLKLTPVGGNGEVRFYLIDHKNENSYLKQSEQAVNFTEILQGNYQLSSLDDDGKKYEQPILIESDLFGTEPIESYEFLLANDNFLTLKATDYLPNGTVDFWWENSNVLKSKDSDYNVTEIGTYTLNYENEKGCISQVEFTVNLDENNLLNDSQIVLYPNPVKANQPFTIDIQLENPSDVKVQIYSEVGKLVAHKEYNNRKELVVKHQLFETGLYFVIIDTNEQTKKLKLIVR